MIKAYLALCFLIVMCLSGCSAMLGRPSQLSTSGATEGPPPERGLRVEEVFPNSPAAAAGIVVLLGIRAERIFERRHRLGRETRRAAQVGGISNP